jgi:hypothetical protein
VTSISSGNGDVVKQAEAHADSSASVVTRWADNAKRILDIVCEDCIDGRQTTACGKAGDFGALWANVCVTGAEMVAVFGDFFVDERNVRASVNQGKFIVGS